MRTPRPSTMGWRPAAQTARLLRDRVTHVGGIRRAVDLGHLEGHVPVESLEQPLTRTEDHRCRRDDQLVDLSRRQRLPDAIGPATDAAITVATAPRRLGH